MRISILVSAVVLATAATAATAATCPAPGSITQSAAGTGFNYAAPGGWKGENPMADEGDLKGFKFDSAKVTDSAVVCRYISGDEGFVSLSLQGAKSPDGSGWKDKACAGGDVSSCAFK